jgi:hypothetical protein
MNHSTPPTLADRLRKMATGRVIVRLNMARDRLVYAEKEQARRAAMTEFDACRAELVRRGEKVPA